jgi:hypothetical protein
MTVPNKVFQKYNSFLTNDRWQRNKTSKDKINPKAKTGLGETLEKAEEAWGNIEWDKLDAKKLGASSLQEAETNRTNAKNALANVVKARQALNVVKVKAIKTKHNQALSKGARDHAAGVANAATSALGWLKQVNLIDFDNEVERLSPGGRG